MGDFTREIEQTMRQAGAGPKEGALRRWYAAVGAAVMKEAGAAWRRRPAGKTACYFSAEFLVGRLLESNLLNLGVLDETLATLQRAGLCADSLEEIPDDALGNGGLGRLAACFLDSGATQGLRLDGYGIRYKYGLFRQVFENGFQREEPDDWQRLGDPFSVRREEEKQRVCFGDGAVWAVPYDMPVIGYGGKTVNTLRLWQAESADGVDFDSFNRQQYGAAFAAQNAAEAIHSFLYPADDTDEGRRLRLKQQYFFCSASLQSILAEFKARRGADWRALPGEYAVQLNDTHPAVAVLELLRLLTERENLPFEEAFSITQALFAYTNHTLMAEALEQWDKQLFAATLPDVWPYAVMVNNRLRREISAGGAAGGWANYDILAGGRVHMARMAVYASHSTNGVAQLHSALLKTEVLRDWAALYPARFNNKTNGVTQRRWLKLCNPALSVLLDEAAGPEWVTDFSRVEKLREWAGDAAAQQRFMQIKAENKRLLAERVRRQTGQTLAPEGVFDVQVKRLHEYKRQLLNGFAILDIYYRMKEGELGDLPPLTCLFGAKAAAGYRRAKGVIKYLNEIAKLVDADETVRGRLKVLFVPDYNVSWAERLIPAADISQQISTAGTEASGTGNMKLAMNGAVTLGTWDGANIEIVQAAGEENNYIFGARVEELKKMRPTYDARAVYLANPRLRRVVDTLTDGTFDDGGGGLFAELHASLLRGASWHRPDHYFLLLDFEPYVEARLRAARDYANRPAFAEKCLRNIAGSGHFSSDRTVRQYASEIWKL